MYYSQHKENEFDEKFVLYSNMLYRLCMVYLKNHANTEDAIQEIFIKLIYKSPAFKTPEDERRWLVRVTINACKDQLKSLRNKMLPIETAADMSLNEGTNEIFQLLQGLPEKYKAPLFLYHTEGFTIEEISTMLSIGKSAVKMRLKRGREMLKAEIEK